jgi:hypothetical protein
MIEAVYVKATRVAMADHIGAEDIRGEDRVTCSRRLNLMAVPIDAPILMIMVLSSATPRVVVEVLSPTPEATDLRILPVFC